MPDTPSLRGARDAERLPMLLPAAAAIGLVFVLAVLAQVVVDRRAAPGAWGVTAVSGNVRIGVHPVGTARAALAPGQRLETDSEAAARLDAEGRGGILVGPGAIVLLAASAPDGDRFVVEQGALRVLEAREAGPAVTLETPSGIVRGRGAYRLSVDSSGGAILEADAGVTTISLGGRASHVTAGARCAATPGSGPATPHAVDAPEALRAALAVIDRATAGTEDAAALDSLLAAARPADAATLWHLLARLDPAARATVYDRLAGLVPPPPGVTRGGAMRGDAGMLEIWWAALVKREAE